MGTEKRQDKRTLLRPAMIAVPLVETETKPMPTPLPALNLIAEPGRRRATLDTAREIERRGFAGISVSSSFGNMSQSVGLALATERIPYATAIAPIYAQSVTSSRRTPPTCTRSPAGAFS